MPVRVSMQVWGCRCDYVGAGVGVGGGVGGGVSRTKKKSYPKQHEQLESIRRKQRQNTPWLVGCLKLEARWSVENIC